MAPFFLSVERRNLQLFIRWCILPAAVFLSVFLPTLLLPFILVLLPLAVAQAFSACVAVVRPQVHTRHPITLRLRGPPAR